MNHMVPFVMPYDKKDPYQAKLAKLVNRVPSLKAAHKAGLFK